MDHDADHEERIDARTAACLAALTFTVSLAPAALEGRESPEWALGTWAGTLDTGVQQLRIVYDIGRGEKGEGLLAGTMAVPNQGVSDIPLDDLKVEGGTLSMSIPVPGGGSYEGELVASGDAVDGIAFLVMLAGSGLPGSETAVEQAARVVDSQRPPGLRARPETCGHPAPGRGAGGALRPGAGGPTGRAGSRAAL